MQEAVAEVATAENFPKRERQMSLEADAADAEHPTDLAGASRTPGERKAETRRQEAARMVALLGAREGDVRQEFGEEDRNQKHQE